MVRKFDIELPELKINKEQVEKEMKSLLKEDFEKGGLLARSLVFCYLYAPASVTEVTDKMAAYYQINLERTTVFRALQKLSKLGLLNSSTSGYVLTLGTHEQKEIHKTILAKYKQFLSKIPESFRKRYSDINYFWVSNGRGEAMIPWACEILNFKCKEK